MKLNESVDIFSKVNPSHLRLSTCLGESFPQKLGMNYLLYLTKLIDTVKGQIKSILFQLYLLLRVSPCLENGFAGSLIMLTPSVPICLIYIRLSQGGFEFWEKYKGHP